ncbi:calmodulin-binding-domain-containing protein [Ochromonadaceae sp. CCMP2298]|nr:calmodulin-binding-domain-containing protein [Ochromonadaceae sp. CCMP2298]
MSNVLQRRNANKVDSISNFLCPANGYRGTQIRNGIQPKNHMKENMKAMRNAQLVNRDKREEESRSGKELYKLAQFKEVDSRLYEYESSQRQTGRRPSMDNKEFLGRGSAEERRERMAESNRVQRVEMERKLEEARQYSSAKPTTPRKSGIPKAGGVLHAPSNTDFVTRNKAEAMRLEAQARVRAGADPSRPTVHEDYGRVPEYLEERKASWAAAEEEQRRRMPDPNCPPGMCLMPEEERRSTLQTLQTSKSEALVQLRALPFVVETPTMKKKQEFLEGRLREIDNAIAIFSKDKVFVALSGYR